MTSQTPKRHDLEGLPQSVREIAEVIGRHEALFLIGKLPVCYRDAGNTSPKVIMYVPKRLRPDHRLVEILGWQTALKLVTAFGGEIMHPANCKAIYLRFRDTSIRRMLAEDGATTGEIAELFGLSIHQVRNIRRGKSARGNPL